MSVESALVKRVEGEIRTSDSVKSGSRPKKIT